MTDSGRQIKTPADAVPNEFGPLISDKEKTGTLWFTAAECAQIAQAYGDCIAAEMTTGRAHGDKWRAKFSKWEKQT